jgi:hypothetical protein
MQRTQNNQRQELLNAWNNLYIALYVLIGQVYCVLRNTMKVPETEEIRWQIVKAMLHDFPQLKQRLKKYLKNEEKQKRPRSPTHTAA